MAKPENWLKQDKNLRSVHIHYLTTWELLYLINILFIVEINAWHTQTNFSPDKALESYCSILQLWQKGEDGQICDISFINGLIPKSHPGVDFIKFGRTAQIIAIALSICTLGLHPTFEKLFTCVKVRCKGVGRKKHLWNQPLDAYFKVANCFPFENEKYSHRV